MEENKINEEVQNNEVTVNADELAKFKETHVSKEEYDKVVAEKNSMVKALLDGQSIDIEEEKEDKRSIQDYIEDVNKDQTNLDYWVNVLAYRDKVMKEGYEDPFLPIGHNISPTDEDRAAAEKVATRMQDMINRSNGNPAIFKGLYQAEVQDISIAKPTRAKR